MHGESGVPVIGWYQLVVGVTAREIWSPVAVFCYMKRFSIHRSFSPFLARESNAKGRVIKM